MPSGGSWLVSCVPGQPPQHSGYISQAFATYRRLSSWCLLCMIDGTPCSRIQSTGSSIGRLISCSSAFFVTKASRGTKSLFVYFAFAHLSWRVSCKQSPDCLLSKFDSGQCNKRGYQTPGWNYDSLLYQFLKRKKSSNGVILSCYYLLLLYSWFCLFTKENMWVYGSVVGLAR